MTAKGQFKTVLMDYTDGIATITMNRPEKLNALNAQLQRDLAEAFLQADADADVRAIIITGAGRAFCSGVDLKHAAESITVTENKPGEKPQRVFGAMEAARKPIIGAINGYAVTGGFEIALACDILVAARSARFADTHALVGVMPGAGLSQKLARIIGLPRAMAISLTGEYIDAETAYSYGLLSKLVDDAELMPTARRLAAMIAEASPDIILALKAVMRGGASVTLGHALEMERSAHLAWMGTHSPAEAEAARVKVMERARRQS